MNISREEKKSTEDSKREGKLAHPESARQVRTYVKGGSVMTDEITKAIDMLYSEETMTEYQKREAERRRLFFKAIGIEDDGRLCPVMTKEEFGSFDKPCKELKYNELKGKTTVEVYFKFEPYHDVSFVYCFEDDTVYESRFYIGE